MDRVVNEIKSCPMCTQGMAFMESLNASTTISVILSMKKETGKHYLNTFISTKPTTEKEAQNVGGAAFAIKYCPWCGRKLDEN